MLQNVKSLSWILGAGAAVACIMLVVVPLFRTGNGQQAGPAGLAGQPAPVFALRDDRGRNVSLAAYRGKVVFLNLWSSYCPPCRAEMPDLERFASESAAQGVVIVGVDQGESADRAAAFANALRITYPIWIDDGQRYGRAFEALGLPTTVIIGRDGTIVRGFDGALRLDEMRAAIAPALHGS